MSTRNQVDAEAQKDPAELEREIDQKRAQIGDIVHALENKLSPGEIIDTALSYVKGGGGEFFSNLSNTVKANPVPTVLTTVGLIWMMAGQNRQPHSNVTTAGYAGSSSGPSMGEKLSSKTQGFKQQGAGMKEKASQMSSTVSESLGNARTRASDSTRQASERLRGGADRARGGFNQMLQEQPLALGAIGIALGALLAAAVPPTRREDEVFGEKRDRLAGQLRSKAEEGYQKASAKGEEMAEQVKKSAKNGDSERSESSPTGSSTATGSSSAGM